jgi:hypothetical protein
MADLQSASRFPQGRKRTPVTATGLKAFAIPAQTDTDLARVLELWSALPEAGRALLRTTAETLTGQIFKETKPKGQVKDRAAGSIVRYTRTTRTIREPLVRS